MKKVLDLIKKNYIAFTVLIIIILIIIASVITIGIISHNRHKIVSKTDTQRLYQYIGPMKNSFSAELTYEDDKITQISSSRYNIVKSIIYYQDMAKTIIPFDSELIYYYSDNLTYYLPKYSTLRNDNNIHYVSAEGKEYATDSFIIYDGSDGYFIPDKSILTIDGQKINLSALSYINANRATLSYYDYANEKYVAMESVKVANLHLNNVDIDLFNDVIIYNKKSLIIDNDIKKHPVFNLINIYTEE